MAVRTPPGLWGGEAWEAVVAELAHSKWAIVVPVIRGSGSPAIVNMSTSELELLAKHLGSLPALHLGFSLLISPESPKNASSVQSLSPVGLFANPWTAARQPSLSFTNFQSLLKLMSVELVMPSNHLIFCCPLLPPSIFPSIRVSSNESVLHQVAKVLELWLQHQSFQ